jgi:hypothetical protein
VDIEDEDEAAEDEIDGGHVAAACSRSLPPGAGLPKVVSRPPLQKERRLHKSETSPLPERRDVHRSRRSSQPAPPAHRPVVARGEDAEDATGDDAPIDKFPYSSAFAYSIGSPFPCGSNAVMINAEMAHEAFRQQRSESVVSVVL